MRLIPHVILLASLVSVACGSSADDATDTTPSAAGSAGAGAQAGNPTAQGGAGAAAGGQAGQADGGAAGQGGKDASSQGGAGSGDAGGEVGGEAGEAGAGGSGDAGSAGSAGSGDAGSAGGGEAGSAGAGGSGDAGQGGFAPGPHPAAPQVISLGGKVLAKPKAVAITYESDPNAAEIDKFMTEMGASSYWAEVTQEYGVGPLTIAPPVHIATAAPKTMSDNAFVALLKKNLGGDSPAWGAADTSTIYVYYAPAGTDVTDQGSCCNEYDGYHGEAAVGGVHVSYAIICNCPGFDGQPDFRQTTVAASHELVEAATDPYVNTNGAFGQTDDDHAVWTVVSGGEVADMCEFNDDTNTIPADGTYTVQRSWSNAAAKAGKNPCVPVNSAAPYFNSIPALKDTVTIDYYGAWQTKGVKIPVNQTGTVTLDLFSEADTGGPWNVSVYDMGDFTGQNPTLSFKQDKQSGSNGDTITLTIKVLSASAQGHPFIVYSERKGQTNLAMGMVAN
jgi:hypothetical protein